MGRSDLEDIERRLKAYRGDPRWVQRQVARERAIRQRRIALASFASLAVIFAAAGAWTRIAGRSPFMREVRSYARWLREPDVGLALDPEWSMAPGQVPGTVIGSTDAAIVNRVQAYLAQIVK